MGNGVANKDSKQSTTPTNGRKESGVEKILAKRLIGSEEPPTKEGSPLKDIQEGCGGKKVRAPEKGHWLEEKDCRGQPTENKCFSVGEEWGGGLVSARNLGAYPVKKGRIGRERTRVKVAGLKKKN